MNMRRQRRRARGVTLVEVLIVVAIMAAISGAVVMVAVPELHKSRVKLAAMSASSIREAAVMWREVDDVGGGAACPTIQDLVTARKLDGRRTDDPWGKTYKISCEGDEVHVSSSGRDRQPGTKDDIRDGLKPAEIEALTKL